MNLGHHSLVSLARQSFLLYLFFPLTLILKCSYLVRMGVFTLSPEAPHENEMLHLRISC